MQQLHWASAGVSSSPLANAVEGDQGGAEGDQTHDHQLRNRVNEVLTV